MPKLLFRRANPPRAASSGPNRAHYLLSSWMNNTSTEPIIVAPQPGGLCPRKLRAVLRYIEANIGKRIRLSDLARVARLSPFHFSREFHIATRTSPLRYVWQRRIELAKTALLDRAAPLVAIAYDCGFSSQSHFTTAFRQATGITPAAFRAAMGSLAPGWLVYQMMKMIVVVVAVVV